MRSEWRCAKERTGQQSPAAGQTRGTGAQLLLLLALRWQTRPGWYKSRLAERTEDRERTEGDLEGLKYQAVMRASIGGECTGGCEGGRERRLECWPISASRMLRGSEQRAAAGAAAQAVQMRRAQSSATGAPSAAQPQLRQNRPKKDQLQVQEECTGHSVQPK